MVEKELLFIKNNEIELESEYFRSKSKLNPVVLICHPHPQVN